MNKKPNKVELYISGQLIMTLTDSHKESLDGKLSGKVDRARVFGGKGAIVSFFDDQQFRTGENWVVIEKIVDEPVDVEVAKNFVGSDQEKGEGLYTGKGTGFKFAFCRKEKKGIVDRLEDFVESKSGFDLDDILKAARTVGIPHTDKIDLAMAYVRGSKNNYRVDNMSSVRFGS